MITVWRGSCNQWDCDEMGHMNVRVYVEKQVEGLAVLAHRLEMPHAFRKNTQSTVLPLDQHIRFVREVHPGKPLTMNACVLSASDTDAVIYQELRHVGNSLAAAFRTRIAHVEVKHGKPFAWSARTQTKLQALMGSAPDDAKPRSIDPDGPARPLDQISIDAVNAASAPLIGMGAVPRHHTDVHGRMMPHWFMGRVSDSVPNLLYEWRQRVAEASGGARMGAAVLEYRLRYHAFPRAGDAYEIYSSLGTVQEKTHSLVHWIMNPETGGPWVTSEAVAITMDLDKRKAVETPVALRKEIETIAPRGLTL